MNENIKIILEDERVINVTLYPEYAPISVENFLHLIDINYFDGVIFHRIIEDFMIQTGGYYIKDNTLYEKEGAKTIKGEFLKNGVNNPLKHKKGTISMARTNDPNSATSQFFLCSVDTPHLDGSYAAFGRASDEESIKIIEDISKVPTGMLSPAFQSFPYEPIIIKTIVRA